MRVKIGNIWHECQPGQPLMVELSDADKSNIANMPENAHRYAVFHDNAELTENEMKEWVKE